MRVVVVLLVALTLSIGLPLSGHAQGAPPTVNVSSQTGASVSPSCILGADGRMHVVWIQSLEPAEPSAKAIFYASSEDFGATFDEPRQISESFSNAADLREVRIETGPDEVVAVAWWARTEQQGGRQFLSAFLALSHDNGRTFDPDLETSLRLRTDTISKEGFANTTSLSLAVSPDGTIGLLGTLPDYRTGFNVYYAQAPDGTAFQEPKKLSSYTGTIPRAAANCLGFLPNGDVFAAWTESHGDFIDEIKNIYSSVSADRGRTFSAPKQIAHVRGVVGALLPTGATTLLLTQLQTRPKAKPVIKVFVSSDDARTFPRRSKLAKPASYSHVHQHSIAVNATGAVAVAWVENSSLPGPTEGLYVATSSDGGRSFSAPMLIREGLFPEAPSVVVDESGSVGVVLTSSAVSLSDRDVLFIRVTQ